jgi:hypothetical protein
MRKIALYALMGLLCAGLTQAATVGSDNAGNYTSWTNGSNGGTGFQAWNLYTSGSAGFFLGSSASQGFGDIDTSGQAFGMWGNPSGGNYAHAQRLFAGGALSVGQSFVVDLAIAFRNGNKGISLVDSSLNQLAYFNVGGDNYDFNGTILGWGYAQTSVFHVVASQVGGSSLQVVLQRYLGASLSEAATTTVSGALAGFRAYVGDTDQGNDLNNLFINNMAVIPEPTTLGLVGLGSALALIVIRRRRA